MNTLREDRGFALIGALVIIMLLAVVGIGTLTTTDLDMQTAASQRAGAQAFYIAEAGLQRAIGEVMADGTWYENLSDTHDAFAGDNTLGNGTYTVEVLLDEPETGQVTIRSTGTITGFVNAKRSLEAIGELTSGTPTPSIFDLAITVCPGAFKLDATGSYINGDVHVAKDFTTFYDSVVNGTVWVEKVMAITESSSITGELIANGEIKKTSSAVPNVEGDATSGDTISGGGLVSGVEIDYAPLPLVPDRCSFAKLNDLSINAAKIAELMAAADVVYENDVTILEEDNITLPPISYFKKALRIDGNLTFDQDTILIIDGGLEISGPAGLLANDPDSTVTIIVPFTDIKIENAGLVTIDGFVQIGATKGGGTAVDGGDLKVSDAATIVLNGSLFLAKGAIAVAPGTVFNINHRSPTNPLLGGTSPSDGSFVLKQWMTR